ncbi:MAG: 5'/3'-nucleotidase SurE [Betaproteobacteria bacterium]|nr:MAG: 5'/3'-nucleotidase SurE [Betaproteobacteria bacterium]
MRILITNDDGVYSPGIAALAQVASRFGEVRVVAPDVEMSSASHSITASRPVTYKHTPLPFDAYRVNGTPGDCVMLGTTLWEKVAVVLSGVNIGTNLGNAIWHSGTLAGAKQAALLGLRGIALSAPATDREQPNFEVLKPWVAKVLEMLLEVPDLPLVNVNFPARPPRGTVWSRQSMRHYDGKVVRGKDPMGRTHYWFTVVPVEATEEGTDRWAIEQGYVSMTPLRLDLTDHRKLAAVADLERWNLSFA